MVGLLPDRVGTNLHSGLLRFVLTCVLISGETPTQRVLKRFFERLHRRRSCAFVDGNPSLEILSVFVPVYSKWNSRTSSDTGSFCHLYTAGHGKELITLGRRLLKNFVPLRDCAFVRRPELRGGSEITFIGRVASP